MKAPFFSKIKHFYLNLKIGKKLLLMYLIAFIIPFVLLVGYGYDMLRGLLVERIRNELDNDVYKTGQSIESKLDSCIAAAFTAVFDKNIQLFLQEEYKDDEYLQAYKYIGQRFDSILALNSSIMTFSVYTNNPTIPNDEVQLKRIDDKVRTEEWYKELKADEDKKFVYVPSLKKFKDRNDKYIITVYMRLPYYISKSNDVIYCMDIEENSFSTFLKPSSPDKEMLLVDDKDRIVASRDKSLLGKPLEQVFSLESGIIEEDTGWVDTTRREQAGEKLIVRHKLLKNNWRVIASVPYNSFLSEARQKAFQLIAVYFAILPLFVLLLFLTTGIWTRRIKTLLRLMKQLEQGNFSIKGSYENGDEFNEMLRSFIKMGNKIGVLINEVYIKEVSKKETELNNLQFLINPHFLYNTLSSIRAMATKNNDSQTGLMIGRLAKFYRIALSKGNTYIRIREEIDLLKCYLAIQKERFVHLINDFYELDESLLELKTLKLVLQPFAENSISHGIWNQNSCINLVIRLYRRQDTIVFEVIDDGLGFDMRKKKGEASDQSLTGGYGIDNVDNRLKLAFGDGYGVTIHSVFGMGTSVEIRMPEVM